MTKWQIWCRSMQRGAFFSATLGPCGSMRLMSLDIQDDQGEGMRGCGQVRSRCGSVLPTDCYSLLPTYSIENISCSRPAICTNAWIAQGDWLSRGAMSSGTPELNNYRLRLFSGTGKVCGCMVVIVSNWLIISYSHLPYRKHAIRI